MITRQIKQETSFRRILRISALFCVLISFGLNDFAVAAMLHCDCDLVAKKSYDKQKISCHEDPQSLEKDDVVGRYLETSSEENELVECDKCVQHCQLSGQASLVSVGIVVEYFSKATLRFLDPLSPQSIFPLGLDYPPQK